MACERDCSSTKLEYVFQSQGKGVTSIDASANVFYGSFLTATEDLGLDVRTYIFPGGTDARYLRQLGIPSIGFSPMNGTKNELHRLDESLKVETFLRGIEIYKAVIRRVANTAKNELDGEDSCPV